MSIFKLGATYKSYLWGGERLASEYGKTGAPSPCAESWELSFHPDGLSTVGGVPINEAVSTEMLGENFSTLERFPMLIKLIDALDNLSVQVHPSDAYALAREDSLGKSEVWYIVDADEGAGIYLGFNESITKDSLTQAIENKTLTDNLSFVPVHAGESYFIPSGTVHAICRGCLICEIQQSSNITYRLYDYGRVDKNGNERELHVGKALDVACLDVYKKCILPDNFIAINKYFTTRAFKICGHEEIPLDTRSFKTFSVVRGCGKVGDIDVAAGDTLIATAEDASVQLSGDMDVLVTELRKYGTVTEHSAESVKVKLVNDLGETIASLSGTDVDAVRAELLHSLYMSEDDITL